MSLPAADVVGGAGTAAAHDPVGELASRVLQSVSAVYLLATASAAPDLDELVGAIDRADQWLGELREMIESTERADRAGYAGVHRALVAAATALRTLVLPHARVDYGLLHQRAAAAIDTAASRWATTRGGGALRHEHLGSCCAADLPQLAENRSR